MTLGTTLIVLSLILLMGGMSMGSEMWYEWYNNKYVENFEDLNTNLKIIATTLENMYILQLSEYC